MGSGTSGKPDYHKKKATVTERKIINMPPVNTLWQYPGETERAERLIEYSGKAKTVNQINRAYTSLQDFDAHLTTLISGADQEDVQGDVNVLMTLRRRVRAEMRTLARRF